MTYKALDIAKWFVNHFDRESGDLITHLKVQKLLYYAEAWSQLMLGRELFAEPIQAWAHGPVVPEVFHEFKQFGWNSIGPMEMDTVIDPEVADVLGQVLQIYGDFPAKTLENMTHADTPWLEARGALAPEERCESVISKEKIREYFSTKYSEFLEDEKEPS